MHGHLVVVHVEGDVGGVQEVVGEVLLDDVALVAAADDEVVDAVLRVDLEDVPEDGAAADLDHRLGAEARSLHEMRVPRPPARMTAFIATASLYLAILRASTELEQRELRRNTHNCRLPNCVILRGYDR